ncbi:uncharacterized protein YAE1 [Ceratitis capitata]|uniref:Essential protein Yae1 N-terminal domain-containing protein n=1 Tax=Ceratitis capitata TaxID=7213 RepID=W8BAM9_CERCA|nr:uncharacterized protein YAE1 [Ceratitis capitata]
MSVTCEYSSDDEDFKRITETNFQKIRNKSAKIGYADGVSVGQEETFQTAFDKGYADGLRTGFEIEKYKSFALNLNGEKDNDLQTEKSLFEKMSLPSTRDASHCHFTEHINEPLNTISKHQNHYVEDFLCQCQQALPLTTNLLASQKVE